MRVERFKKTTIYLDTCAMIELAKHKLGTCTDTHKQEIKELYDILTTMMQEKRILCPLGNQLQEMGMTRGRESAKLFLYQFTNSELLYPDLVQNAEMQAGYRAFAEDNAIVEFDLGTAFEEDIRCEGPFVIHAAPVYSPEKAEILRREKHQIVGVLNEAKAHKNAYSSFEEQLSAELQAEFWMLLSALENPTASEYAFARYLDEIGKYYRITSAVPYAEPEEHINSLFQYSQFLLSSHYTCLPFVWIRANLWAHLMQRPNKIIKGDNLDIKWAAAYLPFLDYVITDNAFCELLCTSGMAELYGTKVYSLKTLKDLLSILK